MMMKLNLFKQIIFVSVLVIVLFQVSTLSPSCRLCHEVVSLVQKNTPEKPFDLLFQQIAVQVCVRKQIQDHDVCKGAVGAMIHSIINSAWKRLTDPHSVCHLMLFCPKQYKIRNLTQELQRIVKDKPVNKQWEKATNRKTLRVMHISDLHPDFFYTPESQANCSQPLCCRANIQQRPDKTIGSLTKQVEQTQQTKIKAGYWGSLAACDLPMQTFDLFLKQLNKFKLDLIIWTGDSTSHDIWKQSQSYNLNFTTILSNKIKHQTNITVIPAMGNHESYPVNVYDYGEGGREDTLKQGLANSWKSWIGQQAYQILRAKGYYSVVLPNLNDLKIISLNTQAGNEQNWYLLKNPTDPGDMLKWLEEQLNKSEKLNQFVYIIGHIPPNNNMNQWAVRYNAIVDRYAYNIRGQFWGHTHNDHIGAHYSVNNSTKLSNYYTVAPSLTTYDLRPPRYRVLSVDYDTLQINDFQQYRLDLRKYQVKQDIPEFQLLYSFKQAYGLSDMRPESGITEFLNKLKTDPETQKLYNHLHGGALQPGKAGEKTYCGTFAIPQDVAQCKGETYQPDIVSRLAGPWRDLSHK